ncbi:MAG TPA: hypothetical protein VFD03_01225 [Clostridia bacterium]|nr:hypothetical protein [Clostridia bacterium]
MAKLKPCPCGGRTKVTIITATGIPSGDSGGKVIIQCKKCNNCIVRWALYKSWAKETAYNAWNNL